MRQNSKRKGSDPLRPMRVKRGEPGVRRAFLRFFVTGFFEKRNTGNLLTKLITKC
jgi:hypothetical protein